MKQTTGSEIQNAPLGYVRRASKLDVVLPIPRCRTQCHRTPVLCSRHRKQVGFSAHTRDHIHVPFSATFVIPALEQIGDGSTRRARLRASRAETWRRPKCRRSSFVVHALAASEREALRSRLVGLSHGFPEGGSRTSVIDDGPTISFENRKSSAGMSRPSQLL